jgi:hypothetical protein
MINDKYIIQYLWPFFRIPNGRTTKIEKINKIFSRFMRINTKKVNIKVIMKGKNHEKGIN